MSTDFAARGRDLTAPRCTVTLGGKAYQLAFNNRAARIAEDVYEDVYHRADTGYFAILDEAGKSKYRAIQAIYYGALIAGGAEMSFDDFDALFTLASIDGVQEVIMAELSKSLPPEDKTPNAVSQPATPDDGPGAG